MFLDYDGTLSPIVDDPDRAFMSDTVGFQANHLFCFAYSVFICFSLVLMKPCIVFGTD